MKRLGIIGAGKLAEIVVGAYKKGMLEGYELVAVMGRTKEKVEKIVAGTEAAPCTCINELIAVKPDIVVEAASVTSIKDNLELLLKNGASLVALSIGAFADGEFLEGVKKTALENGQKIYLASGAVGGFDVLRTLSLMSGGDMKETFCTHKGPDSLRNTPLFTESLVDATVQKDGLSTEVFSGNAKEAIALLPTKVNVAVAASLAGIGVENTQVSINSTYGMSGDDHCIIAEAAGCRTVIDTFSPTADIAGWSVVALLQNLESPVVVF